MIKWQKIITEGTIFMNFTNYIVVHVVEVNERALYIYLGNFCIPALPCIFVQGSQHSVFSAASLALFLLFLELMYLT